MGILKNITSHLADKANSNIPHEQASRMTTISFAALVSTLFYISFDILALFNESYLLALVLGVAAAASYFSYVRFSKSEKTELYANTILVITASVFLFCMTTGGAFGTGFLWIFPFPIIAIALKGVKNGSRVSAVFLILIASVCIINLYIPALPDYELTFSLRLIATYLAIHAITYTYEFLRIRNLSAMQKWVAESRDESRRKDDFLVKLSHQIRTPLNNITLISNLVDRTKLPDDQQDLFDTIIASTNNLVNVVNNIVQISAIDFDDSDQASVSFNLESTIENTLTLFKNQYKNSLEINSTLAFPHTHYIGNPVRIKQLLLNLIENLLKIKSDDKLIISLDASIHPDTEESSKLEFLISAPAVVLTPDEKQNYFLNSSKPLRTQEEIQKSYLDFGIVHKILKMHQGGFELKQQKENTLFKIYLTLKNDKTIQKKTRSKSAEDTSPGDDIILPPASRKVEDAHILLVEDNSINQKIVILSLKNKVKNIEVANNGKEALDKFGTTKYDIILMDIQMPVMNGIVATKKIRELEASTNTHTPIIAITANALSGDKESCLAAGMNDYISKPFQVEVLVQKMQDLLTNQN